MTLFVFVLSGILLTSVFLVQSFLIAPASLLYPHLTFFYLGISLLGCAALFLSLYTRFKPQWRDLPITSVFSNIFYVYFGLQTLLFFSAILIVIASPFYGGLTSIIAFRGILASLGLLILGTIVALLGPKNIHLNHGRGENKIRISQISDLHIGGMVGHRYVKRLVQETMKKGADLIVLTGDIGDGDPSQHKRSLDELSKLTAPLGVFVVLGNHELYWKTEHWIQVYKEMGFEILSDEEKLLELKGQGIRLYGMSPDMPLRGPGMNKQRSNTSVLRNIPSKKEESLIVIAHYPHLAKIAIEAHADLFLAGHTHGGQFWPITWFIPLFHKYARGSYIDGNTLIYVSRGSGFWGPPLRLGQRAELTHIDFHS